MILNFVKSFKLPQSQRQAERNTSLLQALYSLTWLQWAHFISGLLSWSCDATDFYSVSLSLTSFSTKFGKSTHEVTTAVTLSLLLRTVGAIIFGFLSDRFGRKWPLVANLLIVTILELGTSFVETFSQFLAVRSLFGIGMGGIWGLAASTALENLPVEVRGLASGILQEGYALGCVVAAIINLTLVPAKEATLGPDAWRSLFWVASGLSFFTALFTMMIPESQVFVKAAEGSKGVSVRQKTQIFIQETRKVMKQHWGRFIYMCLLMSGFNFITHSSEDLYPTYLQQTKGFSEHDSTLATLIGFCGGIVGGAFAGWISQYIGRRLTLILYMIISGAIVPLWILPSSFGALTVGAFFMQFAALGAGGIMPIHLSEISPPAFRASFAGIAYQIGAMVSSASAQIEATAGDNIRIIKSDGTTIPDYGTVQGILVGVLAAFVLIVALLGPENHGSHFEKHKAAFEKEGGEDDAYVEDVEYSGRQASNDDPNSKSDRFADVDLDISNVDDERQSEKA
ncbi:carboxylic acid transporter protein [Dendrothele bispora CBS 962.96]|uniref:Carboxylic acid transporter protein n=1 Tax=Dendrothele bispora (strain CBS 962.96) TaxID=1314807 RepID=A0A4S8L9U9_DENBC|nr:carboxylic acid transporter protein [Dendrothele bispora CBS 962.96]